MGDVGLCVEFILVVDAALYLTRTQRFENGWHPVQERIGSFVGLDAGIEHLYSACSYGLKQGLTGPVGHLRAQQDSNLFERLPLAVQGKQRANLKVTRRNVEGLGYAAPLFEVAKSRPAGDTVVYDEKVAALGFSCHPWHPPCLLTTVHGCFSTAGTSRAQIRNRDAVTPAIVPDQNLHHVGNGAVLLVGSSAQPLLQGWFDAKC